MFKTSQEKEAKLVQPVDWILKKVSQPVDQTMKVLVGPVD